MPRKPKELEKYCLYCNKKLERRRFNNDRLEDFSVFSRRLYCGQDCFCSHRLKNNIKNERSFKSSISVSRESARAIMTRFNYTNKCLICNKDGKLDIHHIDHNPHNNKLHNLIYLCRSCHMKAHKGKNNEILLKIQQYSDSIKENKKNGTTIKNLPSKNRR